MRLRVFLIFFLMAATAGADETATGWQEAKNLFETGKYEAALQALKAHPVESAQYFYNIGTTYLKLEQTGPAVAYLEKANHLKPHDPEIRHNLEIARTQLSRLIGADHVDPASSALESVADRVSIDEVRSILGLLGLIVAGLWLRAYLKTRSIKRTLLQPSGWVGLAAFGLTVGLYLAERVTSSHPPAFVLERQAIRSGPGDHFVELAQAETGVKLRLLGPTAYSSQAVGGDPASSQSLLWNQVRYSADGIGWIRASSLLLL